MDRRPLSDLDPPNSITMLPTRRPYVFNSGRQQHARSDADASCCSTSIASYGTCV